jgi:hypothetical protein
VSSGGGTPVASPAAISSRTAARNSSSAFARSREMDREPAGGLGRMLGPASAGP